MTGMTYGNYPDLQSVKKILVIKLRHLGDVLLTTPFLSALRAAFPLAEIDVYVYEEAREMVQGHSAVGKVFGLDRGWKKLGWVSRLKKEISMLRKLRKQKYDCIFNLTEGDRGAYAALISGAKVRVGFVPKGRFQKKIYTHLIKHTPTLRHTVERNLDALRGVGIFPPLVQRELFFSVPEEAKVRVKEWIGEGEYVLVHPTSRWRYKCWEMGKVKKVIEWLGQRGKKVVVTSGPDPAEIRLALEVGSGGHILNLAGQTSLKELGALVEGASILLCVDSLPLHLASALKKRVVVLFGPTSDVTWAPWRNPYARVVAQNFSCRPCYQDGCGGSKYSDCLQTLSIERVCRAILETERLTEVTPPSLRIGQEFIYGSTH